MSVNRSVQIGAARDALVRGDLKTTHAFASTVVAEDPANAEGHFLLGIAESGEGRIRSGIEHLGQAVALDPRGEYRAHLAKLFALVRRDGDAAETLRAAEHAPPADALSRDTMGCVYARLGDHAAALVHFAQAVRLQPAHSEYRYNEAVTLNFLGRADEADAALEALIALAPDHARAHHLLAGLRKHKPERNHVARLGRTLARAGDSRDRLLLGWSRECRRRCRAPA